VRLTGGPLKHAQDLDAECLLKLEHDRMMACCRKRAGLEPKAQGYGGWDGDGKNLTGHIAGHYKVRSDLLKNKQRVTVRFQATGNNEIAAVFGIRTIRADAERQEVTSRLQFPNGRRI
jgi:hypothetical protein